MFSDLCVESDSIHCVWFFAIEHVQKCWFLRVRSGFKFTRKLLSVQFPFNPKAVVYFKHVRKITVPYICFLRFRK